MGRREFSQTATLDNPQETGMKDARQARSPPGASSCGRGQRQTDHTSAAQPCQPEPLILECECRSDAWSGHG